jgi:hypothetical protein
MDARRRHGRGLEQRRDPGEGRVGGFRHQAGDRAGLGVGGGQHHGAGRGGRQLAAVLGIGEEAQLPGAGAGEGADAVDQGAAVAAQFQPEALGQAGQRETWRLRGQGGRLRTGRRR